MSQGAATLILSIDALPLGACVLVLERDPLSDQLLARKDQCPNGMGRQRLHVDGFEEAGARQLRQPAGIVAASVLVAEAKAITTEIALEATNRLFELAGTRATLAEYGLDRHWRNARTH